MSNGDLFHAHSKNFWLGLTAVKGIYSNLTGLDEKGAPLPTSDDYRSQFAVSSGNGFSPVVIPNAVLDFFGDSLIRKIVLPVEKLDIDSIVAALDERAPSELEKYNLRHLKKRL